jgi:DHA1 family tetracycline resistance protein-like MFS transporter
MQLVLKSISQHTQFKIDTSSNDEFFPSCYTPFGGHMFKTPERYRSFLTVVLTYTLDLVGFSIVFPVLAPLLLNYSLHYFAPDASEIYRTTILGILFSVFGIAQFVGAPLIGVFSDHYGRLKVFLGTIGLSIIGYAIMAYSVYEQNLFWMFAGRILTGFCSGNFALAQSATADLVEPAHKSRAFGIIMGVGGLGFVVGPWVGGKLANPEWLFGSGAFIFAAAAALLNFFMVLFFFKETYKRKAQHATFVDTFKGLQQVYHIRALRIILLTFMLYCVGWATYMVFFPTFLVQKFNLSANLIGDIYAYMSIVWFFCSTYLNKELVGKFSLHSLVIAGTLLVTVGIVSAILPTSLWLYWIIIPVMLTGATLCWINLGTMLSNKASEAMQGRALGASGAMWSLGQIVAPLVCGPLAGWNLYTPLLFGALFVFLSFVYFIFNHRK